MFHRRSTGLFAIAALAATLASPVTFGQAPETPRTIGDFVAASDLDFHGTVVRIDYATSMRVKGEPNGIPHTFVTYRVDEALHGSAEGEEITLRFLGGLDVDGTYLAVSVTPQFDIGDEDVLIVRGNGESGCPLVADHRGRLRIIEGQAYTDTGRSVMLGANGAIDMGARYALTEVATTTVNEEVFVTTYDAEAIDGPSDAMLRQQLLDVVAAAAMATPAPEQEFVSADAFAPFVVPPFTPVELRDSKLGNGAR